MRLAGPGKGVARQELCTNAPGGGEKQVVAHNSILLDLQDNGQDTDYCWYTAY